MLDHSNLPINKESINNSTKYNQDPIKINLPNNFTNLNDPQFKKRKLKEEDEFSLNTNFKTYNYDPNKDDKNLYGMKRMKFMY